MSGVDDCVDSADVTFGYLITEAFSNLFKPTTIPQTPSCAIYERREPSPLGRYTVMAALFLFGGMVLSFGNVWYQYLGLSIAGFSAPFLFLVWMVRNDRYELEPLPLIAYTFGWGAFCAVFAGILNVYLFIPIFGIPGAAFAEEPLKILGVYWLATQKANETEFNDHLDGMIYGAAVGAGFAGLENFYYLYTGIHVDSVPFLTAIALRSAASLNHIVWSAIAGRSLGLAKALRGYNTRSDILSGLFVAISLHFLWNYSDPLFALFLLLPFNLWSLSNMVKTAQQDEQNWGFTTKAPVE